MLPNLVTYDEIAPMLPGLSYKCLLHMSLANRFVPYVRLSPRSPPLWPADAVAAWIKAKFAAISEAAANDR